MSSSINDILLVCLLHYRYELSFNDYNAYCILLEMKMIDCLFSDIHPTSARPLLDILSVN